MEHSVDTVEIARGVIYVNREVHERCSPKPIQQHARRCVFGCRYDLYDFDGLPDESPSIQELGGFSRVGPLSHFTSLIRATTHVGTSANC